jgi:hypothetical protein
MARYMVEAPHNDTECLKTLDALEARGPEYLAKFEVGCLHGVHKSWAEFEAATETAARNELPKELRPRAEITQVDRINSAQIRSFHQAH